VKEGEGVDDDVCVDVAQRAASTEPVVLEGIKATLFAPRSSEGVEIERRPQHLDRVGGEVSEFNSVHIAHFTPSAVNPQDDFRRCRRTRSSILVPTSVAAKRAEPP